MNDLDSRAEATYRNELNQVRGAARVKWVVISLCAGIAFFWLTDLLSSRQWGVRDFELAAGFAALGTYFWAAQSKREFAQAIRDRRAIRIEAKLDELLAVKRAARDSVAFDDAH